MDTGAGGVLAQPVIRMAAARAVLPRRALRFIGRFSKCGAVTLVRACDKPVKVV
jgi:hypothetical protein